MQLEAIVPHHVCLTILVAAVNECCKHLKSMYAFVTFCHAQILKKNLFKLMKLGI